MKTKACKAVLFDLDGTLLDTEALSDKAILDALGDSLSSAAREELREKGDLLPWDLKKQIIGKQGEDWVPMVISYAKNHWGFASTPPSV